MKSPNALAIVPAAPVRRRDFELEFLPAALEIVETPSSPIGRAIGATIISFFCLAVVWASLGTIDIVATAPGKIVPTGRTKIVQPFEIGVVRNGFDSRLQGNYLVVAGHYRHSAKL